MDFKDRLIEHYVFTENNGSEIVSRYRHEILPAKEIMPIALVVSIHFFGDIHNLLSPA
jgi:hypothetical protein